MWSIEIGTDVSSKIPLKSLDTQEGELLLE